MCARDIYKAINKHGVESSALDNDGIELLAGAINEGQTTETQVLETLKAFVLLASKTLNQKKLGLETLAKSGKNTVYSVLATICAQESLSSTGKKIASENMEQVLTSEY